MRQLALEAEVSVASLYNLIGGRDEIVRALGLYFLEELDETFVHLQAHTPLERARELLTSVIDSCCVPKWDREQRRVWRTLRQCEVPPTRVLARPKAAPTPPSRPLVRDGGPDRAGSSDGGPVRDASATAWTA
jgi:AcrR family transcriptional regulator